MKSLLLIAVLAISSSSSYHRRAHFGPPDENDDLIHPPWWHPKPSSQGMDPGAGRGFNPHGSGWNSWGKPLTSTKRPKVTYPIYQPTSTTEIPGPGSSTSGLDLVIESCKATCLVTSEHSPVCGTDNVTYGNIGRLECAQNCGVAVELSRRTSCSVLPTPGLGDAITACISTCSVTSEFNPVCGTDNVTYPNAGRLECARNCGRNVQISRRSSCSVPPGPNNPDNRGTTETSGNGNGNGNNNGNGNSGWNGNVNANGNGNGGWNGNGNTNGNSGWNGNGNANGNGGWNGNGNGRNPSMTEIIACMQLCPITPESNPVCGTDGVTYSNPGKLLCTQFCGVNVRVRKFAPCSGSPIPNPHPSVCPTSPIPTEVPTKPPTTQDCINKCPVSQEFKPVCGTDGVTYINLGSLQCKMKCGVDVSVLELYACGQSSTVKPTAQPPPVWGNVDQTTQPTPIPDNSVHNCINNCLTELEYKPVCGTDGKTYVNLPQLQCAKRCGINVDVKSLSPCNTSPDIGGNKEENTTEDNGLGFTIPPDVLASLFPEDHEPTVQPTKIDSEEYDLDQRFGEKEKNHVM